MQDDETMVCLLLKQLRQRQLYCGFSISCFIPKHHTPFHFMGKPAARITDLHDCPLTSPVPHLGGPIIGPGASSILIEGKPAAVIGDACICAGATDTITTGSSGVFFEDRPAARQGDHCEHGGTITTGSASVFIGGIYDAATDADDFVDLVFFEKKDGDAEKKFRKPPPAQRNKLINQAIKDASDLLARKLKLLKKSDPKTMKQFGKWFGRTDERARNIILTRTRKELKLLRSLNESHFTDILDKEDREMTYAMVLPDDSGHMIRLGNPFWEAEATGHDSKAGILIHELSHFKDIGETKDYKYGDYECLKLAKFMPDRALYNADSFERFIESTI